MRKYNNRTKKTMIIIGILCVALIIIFSYAIKKSIDIDKTAYEISSGSILFDKEYNMLTTSTDGILRIKWGGDYYLKQSDKDTLFGKYIINMNYLDSAIGVLINELKAKGLYDNSIIVFYGDHHGLNLSDPDNYSKMTSYLGKPYSYDEMLNIPFIIHIPGLGKSETISTTCGQMDIMPTILNMLGIENNTIYFGEDIMNLPEDSNRAIGGTTYMQTGSFIDKDHIFLMSNDSIYENKGWKTIPCFLFFVPAIYKTFA